LAKQIQKDESAFRKPYNVFCQLNDMVEPAISFYTLNGKEYFGPFPALGCFKK